MLPLMLRALLLAVPLAACTTLPQRPGNDGARVGLSFDAHGQGASFVEGLADPATRRAVTLDDPVRIASISKLVVAIGVMRLVEQGRLDLDADVSTYLGWRLRNPSFPDQPVTLRRLLSHTSSLRDHDDQYAIPLGGTVRAVLADPASWDASYGPGSGYFAYANLNFPLIGSIVERVTGERFDHAMMRLVLAPMRLQACFNWPTCSDAAVARAVQLDQDGAPVKDDLHGRRPDCPVQRARDGGCDLDHLVLGENGSTFAPQGGLRISARDLARIGRLLLGRGTIDGTRILSPASVDTMTTPVWTYNGRNGQTENGIYCRFGLSIHLIATRATGCADNPGLPPGDWLGHSGEAYGLRSGLWIDRGSGRGIAYFVTGLIASPPKGRSAFAMPEEAMVAKAVAQSPQRPSQR
ncbi:MAG: serine hydrolase domain-containing protein [Pseudomonadota bacterium]